MAAAGKQDSRKLGGEDRRLGKFLQRDKFHLGILGNSWVVLHTSSAKRPVLKELTVSFGKGQESMRLLERKVCERIGEGDGSVDKALVWQD